MLQILTINFIIHATWLLWLLLAAVWLGFVPFVKPTLRRNTSMRFLLHIAPVGLGLYLLFGRPERPAMLNEQAFSVTVPIAFAGFVLALCGIAFSIWARCILDGNWSSSATVKQAHDLVRGGPYRMTRHPIYTGLLLALLGSALERGLIRSLVAIPLCALGLWLKLLVEEQVMIKRFGEEYLRYRREVPALAPFLF